MEEQQDKLINSEASPSATLAAEASALQQNYQWLVLLVLGNLTERCLLYKVQIYKYTKFET